MDDVDWPRNTEMDQKDVLELLLLYTPHTHAHAHTHALRAHTHTHFSAPLHYLWKLKCFSQNKGQVFSSCLRTRKTINNAACA